MQCSFFGCPAVEGTTAEDIRLRTDISTNIFREQMSADRIWVVNENISLGIILSSFRFQNLFSPRNNNNMGKYPRDRSRAQGEDGRINSP